MQLPHAVQQRPKKIIYSGLVAAFKRNPLLANKPTPSAGSRAECGGVWREAGEPERGRTLPASIPPCYSSRSGHFSASHRKQGPVIPKGESESFSSYRYIRSSSRRAAPGEARSQQEGSSTLQSQGQKALRRREISRGSSRCRREGEENRKFCCRRWKKPNKQIKLQQRKKRLNASLAGLV